MSAVAKLWWLWLMFAIFGLIIWAIVFCIQFREGIVQEQNTSPNYLKEENLRLKRNWVLVCINNGAAGVLGGATMSDTAINACGTLGDKLYPDKDWEHVAMINWERYQLGSSPQEETD